MEHIPSDQNSDDRRPFRSLNPSSQKSGRSTFFESSEHPDLFVRQNHDISVSSKEDEYNNLSGFEEIVNGKKAIEDLERRGVHVAPTLQVIGEAGIGKFKHSGGEMMKPTLFGVSQKVEGEVLNDIPYVNAEIIAKADETFLPILEQAWETYQKGGRYWSDFKVSQFMYGTLPDSTEKEIYLVDTEPRSRNWPEGEDVDDVLQKRQILLFNYLWYYLGEINSLEAKGQGNICQKSRAVLETIIRDIDAKEGLAKAHQLSFLQRLDEERKAPSRVPDDVQ